MQATLEARYSRHRGAAAHRGCSARASSPAALGVSGNGSSMPSTSGSAPGEAAKHLQLQLFSQVAGALHAMSSAQLVPPAAPLRICSSGSLQITSISFYYVAALATAQLGPPRPNGSTVVRERRSSEHPALQPASTAHAGTNRGAIATLAQRRRIQRTIDDLAQLNEVQDLSQARPPLIDGDWELLYSTAEVFRCAHLRAKLHTRMPQRGAHVSGARAQVEPFLLGFPAGPRAGR